MSPRVSCCANDPCMPGSKGQSSADIGPVHNHWTILSSHLQFIHVNRSSHFYFQVVCGTYVLLYNYIILLSLGEKVFYRTYILFLNGLTLCQCYPEICGHTLMRMM